MVVNHFFSMELGIMSTPQSEDMFKKAFENSPAMMLVATAAEGKLKEVNQAFTSVLGFKREDVAGKTLAAGFVFSAW